MSVRANGVLPKVAPLFRTDSSRTMTLRESAVAYGPGRSAEGIDCDRRRETCANSQVVPIAPFRQGYRSSTWS